MNTSNKTKAGLFLGVVALILIPSAHAAIIGIEKPVGSNDGVSRPVSDGVWSVSFRPNLVTTNSGIGYIINSSYDTTQSGKDFAIHDHNYTSPFIPDPNRAVVTFTFDEPTVVSGLTVIQHENGVTKIEGFIGDSADSMVSIGSVFSEKGDIVGVGAFGEGEASFFRFNNPRPGRYFLLVIRKTSLQNGYALYRAFPRDSNGNAIPPGPGLFPTIEVADVDICWPSDSNKTYRVEYRLSVNEGRWESLVENVQGNGKTNCVTDSVRETARKLYRVIISP